MNTPFIHNWKGLILHSPRWECHVIKTRHSTFMLRVIISHNIDWWFIHPCQIEKIIPVCALLNVSTDNRGDFCFVLSYLALFWCCDVLWICWEKRFNAIAQEYEIEHSCITKYCTRYQRKMDKQLLYQGAKGNLLWSFF